MEMVTAWRAGCLTRSDPAGRRDSTGLLPAVPAVFLLPRTDVDRVQRRCWRPVPPSPRWSGAALRGFPRRSHTELQSYSFQQNKQCLRAIDPHKTHTQLLNECIMNTLVSLRRFHWTYLHLHNTRAYCVFTSNILKYVLFSDTVILLNVNMVIILYHHNMVCLNTFDIFCCAVLFWFSFMNSHLWQQNHPLWATVCGFIV